MRASPPGAAANDALQWRLLALAVLLPLLATVLLYRLDVPLGQPGKFVYLYSPVVIQRVARLPMVVFLAALLAGSVLLLFSPRRVGRGVGWLILMLAAVGVAGWAYVAPPEFRSQHVFNMQSPSHDGAFLTEAGYLLKTGVRDYLRAFPDRAHSPPEAMRGTRVLSNPPGTTLIAAGTLRLLDTKPALADWIGWWGVTEELGPEARGLVVNSLGFSISLWLFWLLAGPLLYLVGRTLLPPPTAAVFALVCLFSPATLLFTPGKDPAQLLTVVLPLWLWLLAWRRAWSWAAFLAGGAFILVCLVSLVHVWIAIVVGVATALGTRAGRRRRFVLRIGLPAFGGALATIGVLALIADLNFFATAWSVARSQAEVTHGAEAMSFVWQAFGVPLFVLFAGAALWCCALWITRGRLRDAGARFGLYLLLGSLAVMVATVGFTNIEAPRLWIPFTPLLLLGAALQLPVFRHPRPRAAALLATLVFVQVAAAAVQWSVMDMREAETRLLQDEDGRARFFH